MNIKEIIKHFRTQAQSRFNPSPDGSREAYYNGRKDAYNDCADILERYAVKYPNGWHPASELPPLDENGNSQDVIAICGTTNLLCDLPRWSSVVGGVWGDKDVKWWCYPPKEE